MTLPKRLAREALPCRVWDEEALDWSESPWPACGKRGHVVACTALERPAVEAAIRKAIEACADIAVELRVGPHTSGLVAAGAITHRIRRLLTDEETP